MAKHVGAIKQWASNAVHLVGDFPGDDTKVDGGIGVIAAGFIPGDVFAPTAEETNHEFADWTEVLQWVQDGTSAGVDVAGIVERASDGQVNAERLVVINTQGQSGIDATGDGGSTGVVGRSSRTGVHGLATAGLFPAMLGEHDGNGAGVQGTSVGGYGGRFTGGGAQAGVRADGSAAGSPGLEPNGTGGYPDIYLVPSGNFGLEIVAGAASLGGITIGADATYAFIATQADPSWPVMSLTGAAAAASLVPTLEIAAAGAGLAASLANLSGTGHALRVRAKSAAPTVGAVLFGAQARPSSTAAGQMTYLAEGQFGHSSPGDGWVGFLATAGGKAQGKMSWPGLMVSAAIDAWVDTPILTVTGNDAPKVAGQVMMRVSMMARTNTSNAPARLALQLLDMTAGGGVLWVRAGGNGIFLPDLGVAPLVGWTPISIEIPITVPLAGARTWKLQFATAQNSLVIKDLLVAFGPGML
jgi:hypothetical protein